VIFWKQKVLFEQSEFNFCFQKMLRRAGIAKGMATVPLCFIKKSIKKIEKNIINKNIIFQKNTLDNLISAIFKNILKPT